MCPAKHMSSVSTCLSAQSVTSGSAANADHVGEPLPCLRRLGSKLPPGWDAYEVWRRFIKDARDRRQHQE